MSILTGAELGGGLPPPASPALIRRADRGEESSAHAVPFSNEAAVLALTNSATRAVVQRGQELIDRRNEKNAAEKDQAREVAAEEARNRSLEEQGLKEPETDENQVVANTVQSEVANTAQGKEVVESKAPEIAAVPLGTPAVVTGDGPADGKQETEVIDESGRLDVVA